MTQEERRACLIRYLCEEKKEYSEAELYKSIGDPRKVLRALLNVRMPQAVSESFLEMQDAYLQAEIAEKGIVDYRDLTPMTQGLYLWRGDITTLRCDAIVNAANSQLLGCFCPNHTCIDNAIHSFAGVQLRAKCAEIMDEQGHEEETGEAKITPAYNLPCSYILHTVGPIVRGELTDQEEELLASCYRSCMELADANGIRSIAFCCISTGQFHFPNERAAEIAIETVKRYRAAKGCDMDVIFNVFTEQDYRIYAKLLGKD